jgi:hypothetical protein
LADPNIIEAIEEAIEKEPYLTFRFKVYDGPTDPNFGSIERLPRLLVAGTPAYDLKPPFGFPLRPDLKEADGVDLPIRYATYVKGARPEKGETTYRKLVMQSHIKGLGLS